MDFNYDAQFRRYLLQFSRIFSDIYTSSAPDADGTVRLSKVPIVYGDMHRMVAHIMHQNSENVKMPAPMFSFWITGLELSPNRRNDPQFISKVGVTELKFQEGKYTDEPGNKFLVERYMPIPYDMTVQLDIWTTSTTTKFQILEQILVLFNPSMQLQQNMNSLDWTSIFEVELTGLTWSNRNGPQGTESPKDICTLTFKVPVWVNPPAKINQQRLIKKIANNIKTLPDEIPEYVMDQDVYDPLANIEVEPEQVIVTPKNYGISIGVESKSNEIVLLNSYGETGPTWTEFEDVYNTTIGENSFVTLKLASNFENQTETVMGSVRKATYDDRILIFTIDEDTLPDTIRPVERVIDPAIHYPGGSLPAPAVGQRYLLVSDVDNETLIPGAATSPWGSLFFAKEGDIIEFNGSDWYVSFEAATEVYPQYVKNLYNGNHYRFTEDRSWVYTYLGTYQSGYWNLSF